MTMRIVKQSLVDYAVELGGKTVAWITKEPLGYRIAATRHAGIDSVWFCRKFSEAKAEARKLCDIIVQ